MKESNTKSLLNILPINKISSINNNIQIQQQQEQPYYDTLLQLETQFYDKQYDYCLYEYYAKQDYDFEYDMTKQQNNLIMTVIYQVSTFNNIKLYKSLKNITNSQKTAMIKGFLDKIYQYHIKIIINQFLINQSEFDKPTILYIKYDKDISIINIKLKECHQIISQKQAFTIKKKIKKKNAKLEQEDDNELVFQNQLYKMLNNNTNIINQNQNDDENQNDENDSGGESSEDDSSNDD